MKSFSRCSVILGMSLLIGGLTLTATTAARAGTPDRLYAICVESDRGLIRTARMLCDDYASGLDLGYHIGIFIPARPEIATVRKR